MDWTQVIVGQSYVITYKNSHNDKRHEGKVARVVKSLPMGDFELKFANGKMARYHGTWLEPINPPPPKE